MRQKVWTQGISTYPIAIGLGLGVSYGLFNSTWMLAALSGSLGIGVLAWLINFLGRKNALSVKHLNELRKHLQQEREQRLKQLAEDLKALDCEAGSIQMENLRAKYTSFVRVVEDKYSPHEITFGRYLGIAEQIYLAGVDHLDQVVIALKSVQSIDREYIQKQMQHLDQNGIENSHDDYDALNARLQLLDETLQHVDSLLVENEKAMTQLVQTGARLAKVKTDPKEAKMEMDQAMQELSYVAESMDRHDL